MSDTKTWLITRSAENASSWSSRRLRLAGCRAMADRAAIEVVVRP